jgi:NAD(P)-dependent dehydrogenase (short-subunit alcohol dehydrogenase family)
MDEMTVEEMKNLFTLKGKVAVVTGGHGAFGEAAARGLAAWGADVVVTSRKLAELELVAEGLKEFGVGSIAVSCDVTDEDSVQAMVERAVEELGTIDILVTSAGIARRAPAEDMDIGEWQQVMDINVRGTFLCCKHAGRVMIEKGRGKIVTVGSVRGILGHPAGYGAYGPSKGAVHLMTRQLATEWAKYKINVNCIAPAIFWTPLTEPVLKDEKLAKLFIDRIPLGRAAEPADFVGPVVFLASTASDFVTGQIMFVDGGNIAG